MLATAVPADVSTANRFPGVAQPFPDHLRAVYITSPGNGVRRAAPATCWLRFQRPRSRVRDAPDVPMPLPGRSVPRARNAASPPPIAPARQLLHSAAGASGPVTAPDAPRDCLHRYREPAERRVRH